MWLVSSKFKREKIINFCNTPVQSHHSWKIHPWNPRIEKHLKSQSAGMWHLMTGNSRKTIRPCWNLKNNNENASHILHDTRYYIIIYSEPGRIAQCVLSAYNCCLFRSQQRSASFSNIYCFGNNPLQNLCWLYFRIGNASW